MEPQFPRIRTISGQHDTQLALHQQYLNYRRHSLDIFTFQHNMPNNSLNNNNHVRQQIYYFQLQSIFIYSIIIYSPLYNYNYKNLPNRLQNHRIC